jgi:hypothetical protein
MRTGVQIAKSSFLLAVVAGMNRHTRNDATKRITASTVTIRRFGPSESWKRKKSVLEQANAVSPGGVNTFFLV